MLNKPSNFLLKLPMKYFYKKRISELYCKYNIKLYKLLNSSMQGRPIWVLAYPLTFASGWTVP